MFHLFIHPCIFCFLPILFILSLRRQTQISVASVGWFSSGHILLKRDPKKKDLKSKSNTQVQAKLHLRMCRQAKTAPQGGGCKATVETTERSSALLNHAEQRCSAVPCQQRAAATRINIPHW